LGSPITKAKEVNILTVSKEQSPKTNSLSQLSKQFFSTHQFQALHISFHFFGLVYQGKDIVFKFIIECNNLMNFAPPNWFDMTFWLILKLEI